MFDPASNNSKFIIEEFSPPLPIKKSLYRCDKTFHVDHILNLYQDQSQWGLIILSGEEASFYTCSISINNEVTQTTLSDQFTIHRLKSHKKGGQSAQRFNRIHDNQVAEYIKKICDRANKVYLNDDFTKLKVKGLVVAGIADIKTQVIDSQFLNETLRLDIKKVMTISQTNLSYVLPLCQDVFFNVDLQSESKILENNLPRGDNSDTIIYGLDILKTYIQQSMIKKLIVHRQVKNFDFFCELAANNGAEVVYLTLQNEIGQRFISDYGGVIGIPWYNNSHEDIDNIYDE